MSGGSLDYAYSKVNYIADELEILRKVVSKETEIQVATEQAHMSL